MGLEGSFNPRGGRVEEGNEWTMRIKERGGERGMNLDRLERENRNVLDASPFVATHTMRDSEGP